MTTTVKAKCPGCGDEDGADAACLTELGVDGIMDDDWHCGVCLARRPVRDWLIANKPRTLTDADIEAIASRVVEMMKEGA